MDRKKTIDMGAKNGLRISQEGVMGKREKEGRGKDRGKGFLLKRTGEREKREIEEKRAESLEKGKKIKKKKEYKIDF